MRVRIRIEGLPVIRMTCRIILHHRKLKAKGKNLSGFSRRTLSSFSSVQMRPGQSRITTPRKETDTCKISSGVYEGVTTGAPIHMFVPNTYQIGHIASLPPSSSEPSTPSVSNGSAEVRPVLGISSSACTGTSFLCFLMVLMKQVVLMLQENVQKCRQEADFNRSWQ